MKLKNLDGAERVHVLHVFGLGKCVIAWRLLNFEKTEVEVEVRV
jgi:hypothetical protein